RTPPSRVEGLGSVRSWVILWPRRRASTPALPYPGTDPPGGGPPSDGAAHVDDRRFRASRGTKQGAPPARALYPVRHGDVGAVRLLHDRRDHDAVPPGPGPGVRLDQITGHAALVELPDVCLPDALSRRPDRGPVSRLPAVHRHRRPGLRRGVLPAVA